LNRLSEYAFIVVLARHHANAWRKLTERCEGRVASHHHHHGWTHEQLQRLDAPEREQWMPKGPVLAAMDLCPGQVVADIGAGIGWLAFALAALVGPQGRVIAVDPSPDAVAELRRRADERGVGLDVVQARAEATGLSDDSVDRLVWHTMYHDVHDREQAVREMDRILKPRGLWVIVDWVKRDTPMGPPVSMRLSVDEVQKEVEAGGFRVVKTFTPGPVTWGLVVQKVS
jgi:FkbM family methyltransferase